MEIKKSKTNIFISILAVLSVLEFIIDTYGNFAYYDGIMLYIGVLPCVILYVALAYYALVGYKKPHGDLLRYVFLLFVFRGVVGIISSIRVNDFTAGNATAKQMLWINALRLISTVIIAYIAGRLDKIKKNIIPMAIVTMIMFALAIIFNLNYTTDVYGDFLTILWNFGVFIQWLDIVAAYIIRYKQHKEAGFMDAK